MKLQISVTITILATTLLNFPVKAQSVPPTSDNQVLNACVQNRAETLPIPFSDVSPAHWAFKAVMTMHYCGAFRQATLEALLARLKPTQSQTPSQTQSLP